ncbi:MAG: hypothetical protein ACKORL_13065, partial [Phycisphaerales bacterium]
MADFEALCRDFCVNQKLALKMHLPGSPEPVLDLFGRLRKEMPRLSSLERYPDGEVALESEEGDRDFLWVAMRQTSLKSGWVNPASLEDAYRMHRAGHRLHGVALGQPALEVPGVALLEARVCRGVGREAVHAPEVAPD